MKNVLHFYVLAFMFPLPSPSCIIAKSPSSWSVADVCNVIKDAWVTLNKFSVLALKRFTIKKLKLLFFIVQKSPFIA